MVVIKLELKGLVAMMIRVSFSLSFVDTTRFGSQQAAVVERTCMYRGG